MILQYVNVNIHEAFEHNDFDGVIELSKIIDNESIFLNRLSIDTPNTHGNWELLGSTHETTTNNGVVINAYCAYDDLRNFDIAKFNSCLKSIEDKYKGKIISIKKICQANQWHMIAYMLSKSSIKFVICYE